MKALRSSLSPYRIVIEMDLSIFVTRRSTQKMAEQAFHTLALLRQHKGNTSHVQTNKAVDELIKELNKVDTKEL